MPADFTSTLTGIPALVPSANVQTGSGTSGKGNPGPRSPAGQAVAAVQAALERIRSLLASSAHTVEFQTDPGSGLVTVIVKDSQTGALVRQIPGNALLRLADALTAASAVPGPLVDLTA